MIFVTKPLAIREGGGRGGGEEGGEGERKEERQRDRDKVWKGGHLRVNGRDNVHEKSHA